MLGKGVLRFHAVYWPAVLLSAGLTLPDELRVHGYLTVDGRKAADDVRERIGILRPLLRDEVEEPRVLRFDPKAETVVGDKGADALLTKEYRRPWDLPEV